MNVAPGASYSSRLASTPVPDDAARRHGGPAPLPESEPVAVNNPHADTRHPEACGTLPMALKLIDPATKAEIQGLVTAVLRTTSTPSATRSAIVAVGAGGGSAPPSGTRLWLGPTTVGVWLRVPANG